MKLLILVILFCTSGCGVFMGTVVAPLYHYKEEIMKPKLLSEIQSEAKLKREQDEEAGKIN